MKRLRIHVSGRVQRVGYRDAVAELARRLGIKGTVQNLDDDVSVEIIAEGEEQLLNDFVKRINIKDNAVEVEKVDIHEEKTTGKYKHFKILRGEPNEELGERIDVAGNLLYKMLEKQDLTIAAIKGVDHKQDLTIAAIKGLDQKQDQMLIKQGQMIVKQDETVTVLKETNQKLDTVEEKYGKVSERLGKLESIDTHLKELVDILRAFKPQ